MTITIELTDEEKHRLERDASEQGMDSRDYAARLVREQLSPLPEVADENPAIALLRKWREEGLNASQEERAAADAEVDELLRNLNANRVEAGERPLFP